MQKTLISDRKKKKVWGVLYRSVQHSKNTSHNNLPLFRKGITESISLCFKHSNNWKEVTYPYFSASSLASSSFTILWSSRSLLFPHNTMSGFSQYACICSWPNRNNTNRSHDLLSHTALQEYYCFRRHNNFKVKWLSERETIALSVLSQDFCSCTEEAGNRWTPLSHTQWTNWGSRSLWRLAEQLCICSLKDYAQQASSLSWQKKKYNYFLLLMDDATGLSKASPRHTSLVTFAFR